MGVKNNRMSKINISDRYEEVAIDDGFELSESMEDYIEAIGHLEENLKVVRVKNIAKALTLVIFAHATCNR